MGYVLLLISLQQICKLIEVIVYILVIKSHDVDIPDITVKFKTFNLISTFCSFDKCSHVLLPLDQLRLVFMSLVPVGIIIRNILGF